MKQGRLFLLLPPMGFALIVLLDAGDEEGSRNAGKTQQGTKLVAEEFDGALVPRSDKAVRLSQRNQELVTPIQEVSTGERLERGEAEEHSTPGDISKNAGQEKPLNPPRRGRTADDRMVANKQAYAERFEASTSKEAPDMSKSDIFQYSHRGEDFLLEGTLSFGEGLADLLVVLALRLGKGYVLDVAIQDPMRDLWKRFVHRDPTLFRERLEVSNQVWLKDGALDLNINLEAFPIEHRRWIQERFVNSEVAEVYALEGLRSVAVFIDSRRLLRAGEVITVEATFGAAYRSDGIRFPFLKSEEPVSIGRGSLRVVNYETRGQLTR